MMQPNAKYTIDMDCLAAFFREDGSYNKKIFPSLWTKIENMFKDGTIISHREVFNEIKQGNDELVAWAKDNRDAFKEYDLENETEIIRQIGNIEAKFTDQKKETVHADPWLIAQAKVNNLTLITQEGHNGIPRICKLVKVDCVNLIGFLKKEKIVT